MPSKQSGCRSQLAPITLIIVVAIILAIGLLLAIPYLSARPEFGPGVTPVYPEGTEVLTKPDPDGQFILTGQNTATPTGGQGGLILNTSTPIVLPTEAPPHTPLAPTATPIPATAVNSIIFVDYVVQPGDTLYSISRKFVTSIELMARYGISSANIIAGNVIRVPVGNPAYCASGWQPYPVTEGQTWFSIAMKCGVTVDYLLSGNGGPGTPLYAASIICIPPGG